MLFVSLFILLVSVDAAMSTGGSGRVPTAIDVKWHYTAADCDGRCEDSDPDEVMIMRKMTEQRKMVGEERREKRLRSHRGHHRSLPEKKHGHVEESSDRHSPLGDIWRQRSGGEIFSAAQIDPVEYPLARRNESIVDDFFGTKISDPYRWMEDPEAEETKKFVRNLNGLSEEFLNVAPERKRIGAKLKELWNYEKQSVPSIYGDFIYYFRNTGLQNQAVVYRRKINANDENAEVFIDPNTFSADGTTAMGNWKASWDGRVFAYSISEKGSDWSTIKFKTSDGVDLPEDIPDVKFSMIAWTRDNEGIFYSKYPDTQGAVGKSTEKLRFHSLFYHKLGTSVSHDILVADLRDQPEHMLFGEVSDDGRYLLVSVNTGAETNNKLYFADLGKLDGGKISEKLTLSPIFDNYDATYDFVDSDAAKGTALILTNFKAPLYKLVRVKLADGEHVPNPNAEWETVIDEDARGRPIDWIAVSDGDKLLVGYIEDVKTKVYVHDAKTGRLLYELPLGVGSINRGGVFTSKSLSVFFVVINSYLSPAVTYQGDFKTASDGHPVALKQIRRSQITGVNLNDFALKQVFYKSNDGTKIPMYIMHAKDLKRDGRNPALLTGYGGFAISMLPSFQISSLFLAKHFRMVIAFPALRGGGEYGERWHEAGMRKKKQNVFDDLHAAAEYLIKKRYTNAKKLAIEGGSNGGLLVAACSQQRPDLYGAAVNLVGVMDMLRFQKFTIGSAWIPEFGNPDVADDFAFLIKYSPLHNIRLERKGEQWPATLLMTADHDDRVVPSHTLKYVAELYHTVATGDARHWQRKPLLAKIEVKAGHGGGKPLDKQIAQYVDIFSFLQRVFNMEWHQ